MNKNFKNKKIAVIGMGVEGISSALYLSRHGAEVTILDKEKKVPPKELANKNIDLVSGEDYLENLEKYDLLVRSPGVSLDEILNLKFKIKNLILTSQTKLFFELCPCPIIGVTGTKGKGTTSSLIYEMLKKEASLAKDESRRGKNAYLGGNIGQPPFNFLDKLTAQSIVVLELSSFQLEDLTKSPYFVKTSWSGPHIAVMLMVTQEHLDVHGDVGSYINAKRNLVKFQTKNDFAIFNKDYPASNESDIFTDADIYKISREREVERGCFVKDGKIILRRGPVSSFPLTSAPSTSSQSALVGSPSTTATPGNSVDSSRPPTNSSSSTFFTPKDPVDEEIIDTRDILLPGQHNLENICAAVMAAALAGVSKENIVSVLKTFKGLEHRLELVGEINGVGYYDDSFSTIPESTIAAIEAFENPKILILGGSSKNSDFTELGRVIGSAKNIKAIIGIGEEWKRIKLKIKNEKLKIIEDCKNMNEIVQTASKIAKPGDVVLLSPACASFGMFKNYKDRGEQFKKAVLEIK